MLNVYEIYSYSQIHPDLNPLLSDVLVLISWLEGLTFSLDWGVLCNFLLLTVEELNLSQPFLGRFCTSHHIPVIKNTHLFLSWQFFLAVKFWVVADGFKAAFLLLKASIISGVIKDNNYLCSVRIVLLLQKFKVCFATSFLILFSAV